MTADEARAWKRRTAHEQPDVKRAVQAVKGSEHGLALCRIDVDVADQRIKAARAELDAARASADIAVSHLNCVARSLGGSPA